jgi:hypothetical protein
MEVFDASTYVVPAQPGPEFMWIDGYWYPQGGHYLWHDGYWSRPPYEGAYWGSAVPRRRALGVNHGSEAIRANQLASIASGGTVSRRLHSRGLGRGGP